MFKTSDFDFLLDPELIATEPYLPRIETKMLSFINQKVIDKKIGDLLALLKAGDLLIFNNAKVIKAKLKAKIFRSQSLLEFNLDQPIKSGNINVWQAFCRPAKKIIKGDIIEISNNFHGVIVDKLDNGRIIIDFQCSDDDFFVLIDQYGQVPIPPYVKINQKAINNYQNVFAKDGVAVAAPTAGLHFDSDFIAKLQEKGVIIDFITLNVGAGTFMPVKTDFITDHKMHSEFFTISKKTADNINLAKKERRRVIAVGTTTLRAIESVANYNLQRKEGDVISAYGGNTDIFIYPGYKFKVIDILITNFHLPKSTLFMLICAFIGKEQAYSLYNYAIQQRYRFYSFGDACFLEKDYMV
jgi:S-adenosylmethionine:tRNA ribosyltransferase-isomerase